MKLQVLQVHLAVFYPFEQITEGSRTQVTGHTDEKKNNISSYAC